MSDLITRLYDLRERFVFQGGSEFARSIADEMMAMRTKAAQWEKVFGHLGTADEVGNEWIALKDEVESLRGSMEEWRLDLNSLRTALEESQAREAQLREGLGDEIESGVGIRWVSDTGIHGRPTAHDVREYLERRGESAKCGCDKCTAPQPAIPDGFVLVPKEPTPEMLNAAGPRPAKWNATPAGRMLREEGDKIRCEEWAQMIAAAPEPNK